jgi:hypothetical protein
MFRVDWSRYEDPRLRVFRNPREQVGGDVHNLALRVRAVERSLLNAATALIRFSGHDRPNGPLDRDDRGRVERVVEWRVLSCVSGSESGRDLAAEVFVLERDAECGASPSASR